MRRAVLADVNVGTAGVVVVIYVGRLCGLIVGTAALGCPSSEARVAPASRRLSRGRLARALLVLVDELVVDDRRRQFTRLIRGLPAIFGPHHSPLADDVAV